MTTTKKNLKKLFMLFVFSFLIVPCTAFYSPFEESNDHLINPSQASMCKVRECSCSNDGMHKFKWDELETDVCKYCGYERLHQTTVQLPFIAIFDGVSLRSEPRMTSSVVRTLSNGESVSIAGRIRNEHHNLWLATNSNEYVYVDNVAVDFDTLCVLAYQASCSSMGKDSGTAIAATFDTFRPGGLFDLKSVNLLGNKSDYFVKVEGSVVDETYTGEMLGNILYGFVARSMGFDEDTIIQLGGIGIAVSDGNVFAAGDCMLDVDKCDNPDDIVFVKKGIEYYDTGVWN